MINKEKDIILRNLIKIELAIAKFYNRLSTRNSFTGPVQKFWRKIAIEEELHADIFDEIRQGMNNDGIPVVININIDSLKNFINKINGLTKEMASKNFSESEAYSLELPLN